MGEDGRRAGGDLPERWVRSRWSSGGGGSCVESAVRSGGRVAMRDSRHPGRVVLEFGRAEWWAFVRSAARGEFG
jgi:hypothetical protein